MFTYLVIGKGLMGTAVCRYLSQESENVAILGPDEPVDYATHPGVFASHYDQGRITRQLSHDAIWTTLATRAINAYATIEAQSQISFYFPRGGLYVAPAKDAYVQHVDATGRQFNIQYEQYHADTFTKFPFFHFPSHHKIIYEPPPAGYINPRDLIKAQLRIAQQNGTDIIRETAVSLTPSSTHITVTTDTGHTIKAEKVILAAGAFSNCFGLLPKTLDIRVKTETIILAEVRPETAVSLQTMPTLIYQIESPDIDDIYLLPPIQYPNGRYYLKMGCNTKQDDYLSDLNAMREWMIRGNSDVGLPTMKDALQTILPDIPLENVQTKRCLITYTPQKYPFIDKVNDRLFVVTGGNGSSAKSSDAIGHLGAALAMNGVWTDEELSHDHFRLSFAEV